MAPAEPGPFMKKHFRLVSGAALLALSAVVGWSSIRSTVRLIPEDLITYRPIQVRGDGFVSSQTCKACHPSQYETWHTSYHRTMTQVATPESVQADFNGVDVSDVNGRFAMKLERRGREFWVGLDDPDWDGKGERPTRIHRQIVMVTGSHYQQVYWYRTDHGRVLGQLPAMYLIADHRWIPRSAAFMSPNTEPRRSETGRWNSVCISCHATHGKWAFDSPPGSRPLETQVVDTKAAEFGIACEACHGPGQQHVARNRSPLRRYWLHLSGTPDPTTVQPVRLSPRISSEVCGQCHSVWELYDQAGQRKANDFGFPYRPGDELRDTRFVAQPGQNAGAPRMKELLAKYPSFVADSCWSDGMIRVSGREYNGLINSPCFENARTEQQTMSCFSCHTMHKASDDSRSNGEWAATHQISAGMDGNQACLQCHTRFKTNVTAHTHHQTDSTGSSCFNCHMPYTTYGLLRALRSHQISSPTVSASVQTGRPNACNLCHLDRTLAWTSQYLGKWYGTPETQLTPVQQTTAASLLWLVRGDAGQRALAAWSMGWPPAQSASGTSWMAPYLSLLLNDPYDAVRYVAFRSLRSQPGFADFVYDFVSPPPQRASDGLRAMNIWKSTRVVRRTDPALLLDGEGWLNVDAVLTLLRQRDDHRVNLVE
jgi:hypothetical protein